MEEKEKKKRKGIENISSFSNNNFIQKINKTNSATQNVNNLPNQNLLLKKNKSNRKKSKIIANSADTDGFEGIWNISGLLPQLDERAHL